MRAKPIRILLSTLFGISLLGIASQGVAVEACQAIPVSVVNQSPHDVILQGGAEPIVIKANSSQKTLFQSDHFYSQCGLVQLGLNDGSAVKRGLIHPHAQQVDIRVGMNGAIDHLGMAPSGFDLDEYISWWGLQKVLG